MSLPIILEKYREEIDQELKAVLGGHSLALYDMMRYHLGWTDKKGNPQSNNSGKALRPALCLFSCEAAGGNYHKALPAAAAVELVHNFSLIHDDIQDNDRERRHRPTVWTIWGKAQAINAGTAMRILASTALLRLRGNGLSMEKQSRLHELLDEISLRLIEGQYLDISYERRFDVSVQEYLTMIGGKTAALISGSMEMGAYLGTETASCIASIRDIGRNLGLAFQIRDDILGIWGKEKETGKPTGNDILRRKKSFPVVFALENAGNSKRKELVSIYRNSLMDQPTVNRVLEIFDSVNTCVKAQETVAQYCSESLKAFNDLPVSSQAKLEMKELVEFLTSREW